MLSFERTMDFLYDQTLTNVLNSHATALNLRSTMSHYMDRTWLLQVSVKTAVSLQLLQRS